MRSHAVCNINPTPKQFEESFFTLLVSNFKTISVTRGNCEISEDNSIFFSLEQCLESNIRNINEYIDEPSELVSEQIISDENIIASCLDTKDEIIRLILKEVHFCTVCENCLKSNEFPLCQRTIISFSNKLLKTKSYRRNILKLLLRFFENWDVNMNWHNCIEHSRNVIYKIIVRIIILKTIKLWCEKRNSIIKNDNIDFTLLQREIIDSTIKIRNIRANYKREKTIRKCALQNYKDSIRKKRCI